MSYAILIFVFFAMAHFIYESIVAPSLRARLRYELIVLKKEIERLKSVRGVQEDKKAIQYLRDGVNNLVRTINSYEIVAVAQAITDLHKDKKLKAHLEERVKTLDGCQSEEIQAVWKRTVSLAENIFRINSGGWFFYVVPLALSVLCLKQAHRATKALLSLPSPYLEKISADTGPMTLPV